MKLLSRFFLLAAASLALNATAAPISGIYAFGDSESDNGRRLAIQGKPLDPYWQGRHSNGKVSVEIVAETLGVSLTDYAVGGAFTGRGNIDVDPILDQTGLLDQYDDYLATHAIADPDALYFIYAGANDFNAFGWGSATQQNILNNYQTIISGLANAGAKHFMVVNRYMAPGYETFLSDGLSAFASLHDYNVDFFSAIPVITSMLSPDNPYGFTHFAGEACFFGSLKSGGSSCANPDEYVFWDTRAHLSARAHQVLGEAIAARILEAEPTSVPEPGTIALFGLGLLGLRMTRRRKQFLRAGSWMGSSTVPAAATP